MKLSKVQDVVDRITDTVRQPSERQRMIDNVTDLSLRDTNLLYKDEEFGEDTKLTKKRRLKLDWRDHAEYRGELRDVNVDDMNEAIRDKLRQKFLKNPQDRGKVKFKGPEGTAVVDYDLRDNPAEADIVTTWASELHKVASLLTGGLFQAPPKMLEDITAWAESKVAANNAAVALHMIDKVQHSIAVSERAIEILTVNENNDYTPEEVERGLERANKQLSVFRESLSEYEQEVKEEKAKVTFPRVQLKQWTRTSRNFKLNLAGWKYLPVVKETEGSQERIRDLFADPIKVTLVEKRRGDAAAYWKSGKILVVMGGAWKASIKHELIHMGQDLLKVALGQFREKQTVGRPSLDIQQPHITQHYESYADFRRSLLWGKGAKFLKKKLKSLGVKTVEDLGPYAADFAKDLKKQGITVEDFHSLDDIEFYTELSDAVEWFKRQGFPDEMPLNERIKKYLNNNMFFRALAKGSKGKWKKAVKEFMKAVR